MNYVFLLLGCLLASPTVAKPEGQLPWPTGFAVVDIVSSADQTKQPAYFRPSQGEAPRPLVVSLHTWSGGYDQPDSLVGQVVDNNYNYIHPHFRGPNRTAEATGSPRVISDLDDAIAYAIEHGNVDTTEIHVIGASGGGYATLLSYLTTHHSVKTFSAWVPISNLIDWYHETKIREPRHALEIAQSTTGINFKPDWFYLDEAEARRRSPLFMPTPVARRQRSKLYIYSGVHDGYTGSVPITHSINMYNKVVRDFDPTDAAARVPDEDIIRLLTYQGFAPSVEEKLGKRTIHYQKQYQDRVQLTLFEGGHEQLIDMALDHLNGKRLLAIGDSNGAMEQGWVDQLKSIRFDDQLFNTAVSGNTIGFMNGSEKLNTLLNVDQYLSKAAETLHHLDGIVILLGTNDCKAIFADSLSRVPQNLTKLLRKIKAHPVYRAHPPAIFVVSPPPFGGLSEQHEDFTGAVARLNQLHPELKRAAQAENCRFIDIRSKLEPVIDHLAYDGIHLYPEGQRLIAQIISQEMDAAYSATER